VPDDEHLSILRRLGRSKDRSKNLAMRQVRSASKPHRFPSYRQWLSIGGLITTAEKRTLQSAGGLIILCLLFIGGWFITTHQIEVPASGGSYTEALVGEPQFINPLYSVASDVDADLVNLIFSGLMRWNPTEGLVTDLASKIDVSEDGRTYTVHIRDNAKFHDGTEVQARDVLFTYQAAQNPLYKSPLAASLQNFAITQVDDKTVAFVLTEPFAPFLSNLTIGILPSEAWEKIIPRNASLAKRNLEPIGSGPYKFYEFTKDKKGAIQSYTLKRNENYHGEKPLIDTLNFKFYPDANDAIQALENKNVEGVGFVPPELEKNTQAVRGITIFHPLLSRQTTLYFNQKNNKDLEEKSVRQAIAQAINKQVIVDQILSGNGLPINGPILPGMLGEHLEIKTLSLDIEKANNTLEEAGYTLEEGATYRTAKSNSVNKDEKSETENEEDSKTDKENETSKTEKNVLSFKLTTVQNSEFVKVAELIADQLAEIGILLEIETIKPEDFFVSVIQPRNYEILLTGTLLGTDPDPFPFWHSSQTGKNGLNLAGYANRNADTLLEEARKATDSTIRAEKYRDFQDLLVADLPAVFLYQSTYSYALPEKIKGAQLTSLTSPADRFANISRWYIKTKRSLR